MSIILKLGVISEDLQTVQIASTYHSVNGEFHEGTPEDCLHIACCPTKRRKKVNKEGKTSCFVCNNTKIIPNRSGMCFECFKTKGLLGKNYYQPCRVCGMDLRRTSVGGVCQTCLKAERDRKKRPTCKNCGRSLSRARKSGMCQQCCNDQTKREAEKRLAAQSKTCKGCGKRVRRDNVTGWCRACYNKNQATYAKNKKHVKKQRDYMAVSFFGKDVKNKNKPGYFGED